MPYLLFISIIIIFLSSIQNIYSQQNPNNTNTTKEIKIDEVIIEAETTKTLSFATSPVIATIEQKDIQFAPISNFQDLLNYLQGTDLRVRGVEGIQVDASIRGGTFDQTIVLLNGVNFTDPQTGHFSLNLPIDISMIERIEILQGIDS